MDRTQLQETLEKLREVETMRKSPGFQTVSEHFNAVLATIQAALMLETDSGQVVRLQERHRAFKSMLDFVDQKCAEAGLVEKQIYEIDNDDNERKSYGLE